jgi:hypothetical protein
MRWILILCLLCPALAQAQSRQVLPSELSIAVTVEETEATPFTREMILITIRGVYRRHITREQLVQPDFDGFSWAQLGPDTWKDERLDGRKVKTLTRRMALYPDRAGTLTIGAFTHRLTLTDEGDDWFEHEIYSEPVQIEVAAAPRGSDWWFPVRSLQISDQWSNAPDQLQPGKGVLRVVRLEALGATPEMIPPMPDLKSPSAMIFPHPEQRLVELTPEGPVTYAFWRWTIRPTNDVSTIVEPLTFGFYDTRNREERAVTISAQRVAYGTVTPEAAATLPLQEVSEATLPGWPAGVAAAAVFLGCLVYGLTGRRMAMGDLHRRFPALDPDMRAMRRGARRGNPSEVRRSAVAMIRNHGLTPEREVLLGQFDRACFDPGHNELDLRSFARRFRAASAPDRV